MRRIFVFRLMVGAGLLTGCAGHVLYPSGPFSGRVVDAETGQPLRNAAVVAVWYRDAPGVGHYVEALHDAREVTTDEDGRFTIPRKTHVVWAGEVQRPHIIVYYPGYKDFLGQPGQGVLSDSDKAAVVRLVKAPPAERARYARIPSLAGGVPDTKIRHLQKLVGEERKAVGIDR